MIEFAAIGFSLATIAVFIFSFDSDGAIVYANPERTTHTVLTFFIALAGTAITISLIAPGVIITACFASWIFVFMQP